MRPVVQPVSRTGVEKPKPGMQGITRWKASAGSPPCARGSVSGPTRRSELDERAGPAVDEEQGQGVRLGRADVDEVDRLPVDLGA